MDDEVLFGQTLDKIIRKLKGKYGFKRFLRDGYRTALEDRTRRYYKPAEIKVKFLPHVPDTPPGPGIRIAQGFLKASRQGDAFCNLLVQFSEIAKSASEALVCFVMNVLSFTFRIQLISHNK